MSDTEQPPQPEGDDQEWPTHCDQCGTELQSAIVEELPDEDSEHLQTASPATVIAQDFCPNVDCPSHSDVSGP
jgi:hypothetical protein